MARAFAIHKVETGGRMTDAMKITCVGCGAHYLYRRTSNIRLNPENAAGFFKKNGWHVAPTKAGDLCSQCVESSQNLSVSRETMEMVKPELKNAPALSPSQMAPRIMTTEDMKLVNREIRGVWDDAEKCYMDDWLDEKIAISLGAHVPVAWVREVRTEFFQGENTNKALTAERAKVLGEIADAEKQMSDLKAQCDQIAVSVEAVFEVLLSIKSKIQPARLGK